RLVRARVADLHADDGGSEWALLAIHVEVGATGDLATAEEELLFVAENCGRDDGAGLHRAVRLWRVPDLGILQHRRELPDPRFLLALLVLRGVVPAVLAQVTFFAGRFDALGDLFATNGREVFELGREPIVGFLREEGRVLLRHDDSPS